MGNGEEGELAGSAGCALRVIGEEAANIATLRVTALLKVFMVETRLVTFNVEIY